MYFINLNKVIFAFFLLILCNPAQAEEGYLCNIYFQSVARANENLKAQGKNLSKTAKFTIFEDTKTDIKQCLKECEKEKFKFCNDFANYLEN